MPGFLRSGTHTQLIPNNHIPTILTHIFCVALLTFLHYLAARVCILLCTWVYYCMYVWRLYCVYGCFAYDVYYYKCQAVCSGRSPHCDRKTVIIVAAKFLRKRRWNGLFVLEVRANHRTRKASMLRVCVMRSLFPHYFVHRPMAHIGSLCSLQLALALWSCGTC